VVSELRILKTPGTAIRIAPATITLAPRGTRMSRLIMLLTGANTPRPERVPADARRREM